MLTLRNIQISVVSLLIFGQTIPQRHSLEGGKFLELYLFYLLFVTITKFKETTQVFGKLASK